MGELVTYLGHSCQNGLSLFTALTCVTTVQLSQDHLEILKQLK